MGCGAYQAPQSLHTDDCSGLPLPVYTLVVFSV